MAGQAQFTDDERKRVQEALEQIAKAIGRPGRRTSDEDVAKALNARLEAVGEAPLSKETIRKARKDGNLGRFVVRAVEVFTGRPVFSPAVAPPDTFVEREEGNPVIAIAFADALAAGVTREELEAARTRLGQFSGTVTVERVQQAVRETLLSVREARKLYGTAIANEGQVAELAALDHPPSRPKRRR